MLVFAGACSKTEGGTVHAHTHPESRKQAASSIRPRRACAPVYHGFKDVVKPTSGGAPTHLQPSGKQASNPRLPRTYLP